MAVPAWPPHLQSLKGALLATELQHPAPPVRVNSLLYDARFHPSNDEQLASARVTQGDDVRQWTTAEQVGWILRRPIGEWLYYVDEGLTGPYSTHALRNAAAVFPPTVPPLGNGAPHFDDYVPRKLENQVYRQHELPESQAQERSLMLVMNRSKSIQCRNCFHIGGRNSRRVCSRQMDQRDGELKTAENEACTRCSKYGIMCLTRAGRVLAPRYDKIATGSMPGLAFQQCARCLRNGLNCDRTRPCRECRAAIPGAIFGTDCVSVGTPNSINTIPAAAAVGAGDPEYYMACGYGPWGIGTVRPMNQGALPGPTENDCSDGQPHPFFDTRQLGAWRNVRPQVLAELDRNNGQFYWGDAFDPATIAQAMAAPLNAPEGRPVPLPSVAAAGAQGVAAHFINPPNALPGGSIVLQTKAPGAANVNQSLSPPYVDDPFRPPTNAAAFREAGPAAPEIFRFDEFGSDFDLGMGDHFVTDFMDLDHESPWNPDLNFAEQEEPNLTGSYGGGMDFNAVLGTVAKASGELKLAFAPKGPNDILTIRPGVAGEDLPPTSPLPISGPMFPLEEPVAGVFGTQAWSLDFFPAGAFDTIAGLTVPTKSIELANPAVPVGVWCDEVDAGGIPCDKPAIARCVDRWHGHLNDAKYMCEAHDREGRDLASNNWDEIQKMDLRAYPCVGCLEGVLAAGDVPYAATGTKLFGVAPPEGQGLLDPPAALLNGQIIGGSQGRIFNKITGCNCAKKLLDTYQCLDHRLNHLDRITSQARRMQQWRISLSRDSSKACYLCRRNPGVDHFNFDNPEGGVGSDYLFYMCMLCHGVVITPPDPNASKNRRTVIKEVLTDVIARPHTDVANLLVNIQPLGEDIVLPDRTATPPPGP